MLGRLVSRLGVRGRLGTGSVRAIASAAAALAVLTTIVGAGWNHGNPVDKVQLLSGAAWLPSYPVGRLTLLDGSSAEIAAQVNVASPGNRLDVVQSGTTAYAINHALGSIRRVDGGTFDLTPPVTPIPGAGEGLQAYASADALYAVDIRSGVLTQTDPATLASPNGLLPLSPRVGAQSATLDDSGRLWVLDITTGDLTWIKDGQRVTRQRAIRPGSGMLVLAGGSPVLIDRQHGEAVTLNPDTGKAEKTTQLDSGSDTIQVGGSLHDLRLYVVTSRGRLTVCDLTRASCEDAVLLGDAGAQLGPPIETGGRVFVPDYASGRVWIYDLKEKRVAQQQVLSPTVRFQLLTRDGIVFFNDPDSEHAGVIRLDGGVVPVSKYDPRSPGNVLATPSPEVRNTPPTQSIPRTIPTSTPTNAPRSTATITPKPDQPISTQGPRPAPPATGQPPPTTPPDVPPAVQIVVSKSQPQIGEDVTLKATASSGPDPTSAQWTFGDGQGSNDVLTTHRWDNAQTYQVTVRVTFPNRKTSTASLPIQVISTATPPPPTPPPPTPIPPPPTPIPIPPTPTPLPPTPPPTPIPTPAPSAEKCSPTSAADRPADGLTIKSPGSGDRVGARNNASGKANLTSNQRLWLLLCAPKVKAVEGGGVGGFYLVGDGPGPASVSGGAWEQGYGVNIEFPDSYKLYAVVVNADQQPYEFVVHDENGKVFGRQLPQNAHYVHVDVTCCS